MPQPDCLSFKWQWRLWYAQVRAWNLFWLYLFAVSEELVQLVWCSQHLPASLHQLQEVSPWLIQAVLPLSNGGRIWVATVDHLVHHFVDLLHALLANAVGFWGKLGELLLKHLKHRNYTTLQGLDRRNHMFFTGQYYPFYLIWQDSAVNDWVALTILK